MTIGKDKVLHFVVSMAIAMGVMSLCMTFGLLIAMSVATIVCVSASLAKEIYDCHKKNPTGFDWYDLLADFLGMSFGELILLIF